MIRSFLPTSDEEENRAKNFLQKPSGEEPSTPAPCFQFFHTRLKGSKSCAPLDSFATFV